MIEAAASCPNKSQALFLSSELCFSALEVVCRKQELGAAAQLQPCTCLWSQGNTLVLPSVLHYQYTKWFLGDIVNFIPWIVFKILTLKNAEHFSPSAAKVHV